MSEAIADHYKATVVVTSDTCSVSSSMDTSGEYVAKQLSIFGFVKVNKLIIEDDRKLITDAVKTTVEDPNNVLTITVGGTGLCPRDVTPEATSVLYDRTCNGIVNALYMTSLRYSVHASLSRLTAGISGHALEQIRFDQNAIKLTHELQDTVSIKTPSHNGVYTGSEVITLISPASSPTDKTENLLYSGQDLPLVIECPLTPEVANSAPLFDSLQNNQIQTAGDSCSSKLSVSRTISPARNVNIKPVETIRPIARPVDNSSKTLPPKVGPVCSPYPMLDYSFVLELLRILSHEVKVENSTIILDSCSSLQAALGNILANDIYSKNKVPPFPVSMMDGYALHIPDRMLNKISSIKTLQAKLVVGLNEFETLQADPKYSKEFFCYQINTGGKVPRRNYAIVPFEQTLPKTTNNTIPILKVNFGKHVRAIGSDLNCEDSLMAGTRIGPVELALIQSMGHRMIEVVKKPVIGVLSTGDELVNFLDIVETLNSEKVIDTNGPLLSSVFEYKGYTVKRCGIVKDNPEDILLRIVTSLRKCDVLVITGGASMGLYDYVKGVIEAIGGVIHFGKVNIKPGKPAALASVELDTERKFIFSLPGNPVSAYITAVVLVIPFIENAIRIHIGKDLPITFKSFGELITVEVGSILDSEDRAYIFDGRLEFLRAKLVQNDLDGIRSIPLVTVTFKQQSSRILNLKDCDCLIIRDPSLKGSKFLVGQIYPALRMNH